MFRFVDCIIILILEENIERKFERKSLKELVSYIIIIIKLEKAPPFLFSLYKSIYYFLYLLRIYFI
jgi:hypothetical protein